MFNIFNILSKWAELLRLWMCKTVPLRSTQTQPLPTICAIHPWGFRRQSLPPPQKIPPPPSSSRMALRESPPPLPPPTTPSIRAGWHHRPRLPSTCCRRSNEFKWTFLFVCQKFPSGILFHRYFIVLYSRPASSWQSIYSPPKHLTIWRLCDVFLLMAVRGIVKITLMVARFIYELQDLSLYISH